MADDKTTNIDTTEKPAEAPEPEKPAEKKSFFKKAKRSNTYLKLLLGGVSGSGKTYSALRVAKGFMGGSLEKVGVLDTEDSAELYDHLGEFNVLPVEPPFDPRRLEKAIDIAISEGIELLIIDSATKFWEGKGGTLDIHEKFGGQFRDWKKTNKIWDSMIQKIVHADIHIICCVRKKSDYESEKDQNGKTQIRKLGMKNMIRDGYEYEFTCGLDLDLNHTAVVSKDRTSLFEEICPTMLTEEHGEILAKWCKGEINKHTI